MSETLGWLVPVLSQWVRCGWPVPLIMTIALVIVKVHVVQWFSKSDLWEGMVSITWELGRNEKFGPHARSIGSENVF